MSLLLRTVTSPFGHCKEEEERGREGGEERGEEGGREGGREKREWRGRSSE